MRDVCDVAYWVLQERVERAALARRQEYAVYDASGRFEMSGTPPTIEEAMTALDEALESEPVLGLSASEAELLELMGVG